MAKKQSLRLGKEVIINVDDYGIWLTRVGPGGMLDDDSERFPNLDALCAAYAANEIKYGYKHT